MDNQTKHCQHTLGLYADYQDDDHWHELIEESEGNKYLLDCVGGIKTIFTFCPKCGTEL